jgi:hypothetical protein
VAVEASKEEIGRHMQLPDYQEGVAAMMERRLPNFGAAQNPVSSQVG